MVLTEGLPTINGKPKARGAGQPPRTYTKMEWAKGYTAWVLLLPLYAFLWFMARAVKRLPQWAVKRLLAWHERKTSERPQDVRIPGDTTIPAYMLRWWQIMRNAYMNVYLHRVFRSDEDVALHDHPWWSFSIVLEGGYYEHRILNGGIHEKIWRWPGDMEFRHKGSQAHRLELARNWSDVAGTPDELPCRTIFITGPVLRRWGFHDKNGWVDAYDWDDYCKAHGLTSMKMSGYAEQLKKAGIPTDDDDLQPAIPAPRV